MDMSEISNQVAAAHVDVRDETDGSACPEEETTAQFNEWIDESNSLLISLAIKLQQAVHLPLEQCVVLVPYTQHGKKSFQISSPQCAPLVGLTAMGFATAQAMFAEGYARRPRETKRCINLLFLGTPLRPVQLLHTGHVIEIAVQIDASRWVAEINQGHGMQIKDFMRFITNNK